MSLKQSALHAKRDVLVVAHGVTDEHQRPGDHRTDERAPRPGQHAIRHVGERQFGGSEAEKACIHNEDRARHECHGNDM